MKTFVLGLDGATFEQLDPMMAEGLLPNIKKICDKYTKGSLETIIPPVTAPAWLAMATGLNPGKTGVFDYINRVSASKETLAPVSSKYYSGKAVWDLLNNRGYKTGIFNYPTLAPAPEVDGFVLGGMGADNFTKKCYPKQLSDEITKKFGSYKVLLNLRSPKYRKNINLFFDDINYILETQTKVMKYLILNKEWDFFFGVYSITDWIQHVLWKDIDDTHPLYDKDKSPEIRQKYLDIWKRLDEIIGELQQSLPVGTNFLIVSDHGSGPLTSVFYPNSWLEKKGWLKKKKGMWFKRYLSEKLTSLSESFDNKYSNLLAYRIKKRVLKIGSTIDFIDIDNSLAYSPEHNTMYGCLNITEKGKRESGFRKKIVQSLENLPNEFDEIKSVELIFPEDIYTGKYSELSPDIFFIINKYEATVEIPFKKDIFIQEPSVYMRTGSHRPKGVFMAAGDNFKKTEIKPRIIDIAPTILALYGIEIPESIDGTVLTDCIKEDKLKSMNIKKGKGIVDSNIEQNEEDMDKMKDMLTSLGYM